MEKQVLTPLLSEQSLLWVGAGVLILAIVGGICVTYIMTRHEHGLQNFRGGSSLYFFTILAVTFSTVLLGLERILTGEAVAGILSGIVGYVLGALKGAQHKVDESN